MSLFFFSFIYFLKETKLLFLHYYYYYKCAQFIIIILIHFLVKMKWLKKEGKKISTCLIITNIFILII